MGNFLSFHYVTLRHVGAYSASFVCNTNKEKEEGSFRLFDISCVPPDALTSPLYLLAWDDGRDSWCSETCQCQGEEGHCFSVKRNCSSQGMVWLVTASFLLPTSTYDDMSTGKNWCLLSRVRWQNIPPRGAKFKVAGGFLEVAAAHGASVGWLAVQEKVYEEVFQMWCGGPSGQALS